MKIFLTGLPGSGKTTCGRKLAERLGWDFIDIDENIQKREGKSISEIFEEKGEEYFRFVESDELKKVVFLSGDAVISHFFGRWFCNS